MPRCFVRYLIYAVVLVGIGRPIVAATGTSEYDAKAAFLYNLLKFVQWPSENNADPSTPFVACVVEPDPFGSALSTALHQKAVAGRPIELRQLKTTAGIRDCQVVFIPIQDSRRIASVLRAVHRMGVLTVGETTEFLDAGGMVSLILTDGKLRLQVNIEAIHAADLRMSAQLLRLAQDAKGGR